MVVFFQGVWELTIEENKTLTGEVMQLLLPASQRDDYSCTSLAEYTLSP